MAENEKFPLALPAGTVLAGQYVIDKVLGQGGFGITYAATDHNTNQKVAVKEFFPDSLAYREQTTVISYPGERTENYEFGKDGFLQEAKTLAEFIGCDNIVRIYSYFEENGTAYFVMEYIEGESFDNYLKKHGGKISAEEAKKILIPIMDALAIVHSKGIVHRDVTPDNIYITNDGKVKLLDFGAARYSLGDKSRSLDVILKHGFAPKEQYTRHGKQGPFTDVYSLGATFYFALTGRRPPDSIDRMEEDEMIPPSTLGADITPYEEEAILQAMAVNPQSRYQSMTAFKNVFMNLSGGQAAAAPTVQQQFFTAPQQPAGQTMTQPVGQTMAQPVGQTMAQPVGQTMAQPVGQTLTQPVGQTMAQPVGQTVMQPYGQPVKKKTSPLLIGGIIAAAVAAVAGICIGVVALVNSNSQKPDTNDGNSDPYVTSAAAPSDTYNEPVVTTAQNLPAVTTEPPAPVKGDARLIGERFSNIITGGLLTFGDDGKDYFLNAERHTLRAGTEELYSNMDGVFSNLIYYSNHLFFVYDGTIYSHDLSTGSCDPIPELQQYKSKGELYFFISPDYYFVFNYDSDKKYGTLYRISRATGQEEESIDIRYSFEMALSNGYLYYIGEDNDGNSSLFRTDATDFHTVINYVFYNNGVHYKRLSVDDSKVYALVEYQNDETMIIGYNSELDLNNTENYFLTKWARSETGSENNRISVMNALNGRFAVTLCSSDYSIVSTYYVTGSGESFTGTKIVDNCWRLWFGITSDGYEIDFVGDNGNLKYKTLGS